MTIGIGGWGSRRKPMSIVKAILRSDLTDLTIVSYAGPDLGMLCAAGKVRRAVYAFASLDSIPLEPHFRRARQAGAIEDEPHDEGTFLLGAAGGGVAGAVPADAGRARLRPAAAQRPAARRSVARSATARSSSPCPPSSSTPPSCHLNVGDARGNAAFLGPDLYFDDLFLRAAPANRFISVERIVPDRASSSRSPAPSCGCASAGSWSTASSRRPAAPPSRRACPTTSATRCSRRTYADVRLGRVLGRGGWHRERHPRADVCAVAIAECFRGDGEILANPIGTTPMIGGRLARATFEPDLMMTDGEAMLVANDEATDFAGGKVVESYNPYRSMFDVVWWGRRHVIMGASQLDALRQPELRRRRRRLRASPRCSCSASAARRATPSTTRRRTGSPTTRRRCSSSRSTSSPASAGTGPSAAGPAATRYWDLRRVVTNLCVLDFETPDRRLRLRSVHPERDRRRGRRRHRLRARRPRRRARDPAADPRGARAPRHGHRPRRRPLPRGAGLVSSSAAATAAERR